MDKSDANGRRGFETPEVARWPRRSLVIAAATALGILSVLWLLDPHTFRIELGAFIAASAAYLLLGPAMSSALRLLNGWWSQP